MEFPFIAASSRLRLNVPEVIHTQPKMSHILQMTSHTQHTHVLAYSPTHSFKNIMLLCVNSFCAPADKKYEAQLVSSSASS